LKGKKVALLPDRPPIPRVPRHKWKTKFRSAAKRKRDITRTAGKNSSLRSARIDDREKVSWKRIGFIEIAILKAIRDHAKFNKVRSNGEPSIRQIVI